MRVRAVAPWRPRSTGATFAARCRAWRRTRGRGAHPWGAAAIAFLVIVLLAKIFAGGA